MSFKNLASLITVLIGLLVSLPASVTALPQGGRPASPLTTGRAKQVYAADLLKLATKRVKPDFPPSSSVALIRSRGPLVVVVNIDKDGNVIATKFVSGCSLLRAAVIEAAKAWKFEPLNQEGVTQIVGPLIFDHPLLMMLDPARSPASYLKEETGSGDMWIAHCRAARSYWWRKQYSEAESEYRKGIPLSPQAEIIYYNLGEMFYDQDRLEEALKAYQKALEINPQFVEALISVGWMLERLKQPEQAVAAFKEAVKISPDLHTIGVAYINLQGLYKTLKRTEDELDALKQNLNNRIEKNAIDASLAPPFSISTAAHFLAWRYRELGHYRDAIEIYEKGLAIDPRSTNAWDSYFGIAYSYAAMGDKASALKIYDKMLRLTDASLKNAKGGKGKAEVYQGRGEVYEHLKRDKEAIESYRKAAQLLPTWADPHIALKRLYLKLGDKSAAEKEEATLKGIEESEGYTIKRPN